MAKKNEIPKEHLMSENVLLEKLASLQPQKTLLEIKGKNILVVHELETAIILARLNSVTYVTDDIDTFNKFKSMTGYGEFGNDDQAYFVDGNEITWQNFIKKIEEHQANQGAV